MVKRREIFREGKDDGALTTPSSAGALSPTTSITGHLQENSIHGADLGQKIEVAGFCMLMFLVTFVKNM